MLSERDFRHSSLCVVGNLNRDLKTAPIRPDPSLFSDGETPISSVAETIGGGGANSACAAATLGARVTFLGKIGADPLGSRLERTLRHLGMATHLIRDQQHPTGTSIALSFESGQRHFLSCLPAISTLRFEDLPLEALDGHDHLLRADIWFSESMLFEGNQQLFQSARKQGLSVSIDLNWDPRWGRAGTEEIRARKEAVRSVLRWVNLVHGNVRELTEFSDAPDLATALKRIEDWGAESVLVHLGQDGGGCYHRGSFVVQPSEPVERPVHTTGTGDVFSVCMMLLHKRKDIAVTERMQLANHIVAGFMAGARTLIPPLRD